MAAAVHNAKAGIGIAFAGNPDLAEVPTNDPLGNAPPLPLLELLPVVADHIASKNKQVTSAKAMMTIRLTSRKCYGNM